MATIHPYAKLIVRIPLALYNELSSRIGGNVSAYIRRAVVNQLEADGAVINLPVFLPNREPHWLRKTDASGQFISRRSIARAGIEEDQNMPIRLTQTDARGSE